MNPEPPNFRRSSGVLHAGMTLGQTDSRVTGVPPTKMVSLRIMTGQQMLDHEKSRFTLKDYQFDKELIRRIDELVPDFYTAGPNSRTPIGCALDRATKFIHDTCPAGLKCDIRPHSHRLFDKCRVLGSFIPVHHFPKDGHVLDRFLKGLVEYLEEQNTRGGTAAAATGNRRQSSGATASIADGPHPPMPSPEIIETHSLAPVKAGSDQRSAIKIESDTEAGMSPIRKKAKKKRSTRRSDRITKKRHRDKPNNVGDAAEENTERTQPPPRKKARMSSHRRESSPVIDLSNRRAQTELDRVSSQLRRRLTVTHQDSANQNHEADDSESSQESDSGDPDFNEQNNEEDAVDGDDQQVMRDTRRRKPLNVYKTMYEDGQDEIRFLQDLLIKGAGFTEADLKASRVRVKNGKSFKYAFELAFDKNKEKTGSAKDGSKKRPRVSV